ncbi:RNA-directed DNA polymerase, eukaryota, Reverse transcriptase zinc-binding domain protein [Artemisia annua]|uniref:RNA-directed DNA polymerase, eukaryota, Reverse transcriptase zinc-binding domain protein n=1 Tax=Artemisia annua TaxID=35608 RepID=A0A2U1LPH4_ARTAN|nr:RNA-directed DNA polymerase, eukaryota, Reverse transcriptase zinc-binding domain protein [Artemisia annua]
MSQESLKVVKKHKNDDDIFGLNSLLGLNGDGPNENEREVGNTLDLNDHSVAMNNSDHWGNMEQVIGPSQDSHLNPEDGLHDDEIEATKVMGDKLGVDLNSCDRMIRDSIVQEGLQNESMSSNVSPGLVSNCWGGLGFEYETVDAIGNSGGLISIWDPKFLSKDVVVKNDNFLLVSGILPDGNIRINMLNVYAPQNNVEKRNLWAKILRVIQSGRGWWVVFGDFNAVREPGERKNSIFDPVCSRDFNDFVEEAGLREYSLKGMQYTYMVNRRDVCKLSRIDRIFVCDNVFNNWPNACVRALNREFSDHAPLILTLNDTNFGPKPFRWFDSWIDRPGCEEVINSVLVGWSNVGPADTNLMRKLKSLRDRLKVWVQESRRKETEDSLEEIELYRSRDLKQKSRVKWASLGDENTSFFHGVVNGRKAKNVIPGLEINGEWVSKPKIVKREVLRFFRQHF